MAAMLDGRNKEKNLHDRFHFPEERNCIVPAIQHGCRANPLQRSVAFNMKFDGILNLRKIYMGAGYSAVIVLAGEAC